MWLAQLFSRFQALFEFTLFGVCAAIGHWLGVATGGVRLVFIYLSFFTFGSPIIIYFIIYFLMNIHKYLRRSRSTVWDF